MNKTFIRFSEYLESPTLKGTSFTREDVLATYSDYYNRILGHNVPGDRLRDFYKMYEGDLTKEEANFLGDRNPSILEDCYFIATFGSFDSTDALLHEIAHGMYHLCPEYRKTVDIILAGAHYSTSFESMEDILEYKQYDEIGTTLEAIMSKNDKKLAKRYKKGFSKKEALNRDLKGEREILEKTHGKSW